jgi:hypothetical protein
MEDNERRGVAAPSQRPRSPRVPVEFSVDVEGNDLSGKPFQAVGSVVKLTPPFGRQLDAEVNGVWHDEVDGRQMIGVKLLAADGWFAD